ncbi:RimK family protein [Pseudomonas aeruginosa]
MTPVEQPRPPALADLGSRLMIVVERREDWASYLPSEEVLTAQEYLEQSAHDHGGRRVQVINLCRGYKYLGLGYYCSLLAEARGHRVIPSLRCISELARKSVYGLALGGLDKALDKAPVPYALWRHRRLHPDPVFRPYRVRAAGRPRAPVVRSLSLSDPAGWSSVASRAAHIEGVRPGVLNRLRSDQEDVFADALDGFSRRAWRMPRSRRVARYDMAILHDPDEALPPSNPQALANFVRVGASLGIDVELIGRKDYARLAEFDALLIRETTRVDHHTYRFAEKAEREGLVVMDDPASILRCTNKVYLADLLGCRQLGMPLTEILYKERPQDWQRVARRLGFPLVLKIPDGCFSRGVVKVSDDSELLAAAGELFERSVLLLAQEFFYTEYDWRIGVLDRQPLYACQYFMSRGHWQIYNHKADGQDVNGECRAVPLEQVPPAVLELALEAAGLIGDGLYGVDLKQAGDKVLVIEVNDNPNIDAGVEDGQLGDELYRRILQAFVQRLELKHRGQLSKALR